MNRAVKLLLIAAGTFFVGLGFVGIFLPLLPTTPFLLLAAVCYSKSSGRFYNWLLRNSLFGQYIRDWREGRGLPIKTKIISIALLAPTIGYSILFVVPNILVKFLLALLALGLSMHIVSLPTKININNILEKREANS